MGQQQSKDELLYQQVSYGNVEGIKELRRKGAGLEWIDREGKTPLIVSCMKPGLLNVAKTLIELGANLNAYRPGRYAGTPLHHAAKRGLEDTVKLLLSHGANALVINDDCQTPLEVARAKGSSNVVRAIESHVCLFSGWLREFHGPGFLETLAPQFVSRKVWVVVLPCGARTPSKPFKLELAIYPSTQDAKPRTVIALWKASMEEPKFDQPDPVVTIIDNSGISKGRRHRRSLHTCHEARCTGRVCRQMRIRLAPSSESEKQQLQLFCSACKGIPQGTYPAFLQSTSNPVPPTAPVTEDTEELAMAISASLHSALDESQQPQLANTSSEATAEAEEIAMAINASLNSAIEKSDPQNKAQTSSLANAFTSWNNSVNVGSQSGGNVPTTSVHEAGPSSNFTQDIKIQNTYPSIGQATQTLEPASIPSAPPLDHEVIYDGPVHYPSVDYTPVDLSVPGENSPGKEDETKGDKGASSSCVICLDAPVEGACIPCGHMAGCMSCLNEIKAKEWGCPLCRSKVDQVIRLYAV